MRPTREAPITNGRVKRNRLTIEGQLPIGGREWGYYFPTTTTTASMRDRPVGEGNIKHALFENCRNELYKPMRQLHYVIG